MAANDKKANTREGVLYIRSIPRDVKDKFKAWCALRGVSMTAQIEQLMRDSIKKEPVEA